MRYWILMVLIALAGCAQAPESPTREETATPTRARAARPSSRKPPRRKRPSGPVPPLAKLDQRVVDAVVSGQRAVNHDLYEDVFQAWFRTHLVHHDWDVLEKGAALPDFFTACVESMDSDWVGFGWQDHLDLCHQWMKERPRSVAARTAFARVALACLWSEHRETDDDEALEREIAQSLNPDRVSQAPPEFGCTLLEFDLLKRVDAKTFESHRNLLPADEPEATLLAAVRESSWFNDGPEADDWWQSIDDPAQLAQASEKLGHYPFARSFRRKKNVYRQAPPQDQEADAWAAVAANCQDIRLLNAAARSWMPAFHPDLGVEALEKIGPNFTLSEWTNFRDYERLREQYLAGRPAAPLGPDPTEDLSFFEVRPMGLEGVLLGQQIRDLVLRERPHELHAIAAALHKSDARLPNGQSKFVAFMHGLNDTRNVSREREEQFDKTLNLWYAAYPKSDLPKLAGAYAYTNRAEWYRGVEEQASLGLLQEADAMLQTIGVQSPWRVEAQLLQLQIAPSLGRPTDGLIASLSKTASDRVEFYEGVGRALGGLPPDRRAEVMERCVQASRARWGDGAYALMADAIVRSWGPNLVVLDWARIDRGYQDLDQRYPSWTHAQKRLFHAYLFQKKKEAMEQVEAMGIDRVDFRFFGGTGNLKQFKDWLEE